MRMRKKKWQDQFLSQDLKNLIKEPFIYRNHWQESFGFNDIHLEIGSGKGDYWLQMAKMYPDKLFIAVEKDPACVAVALRKVVDLDLNNAFMIIGDANQLELMFDCSEVNVIHLNFSDPWPKSGYHKRRLTANTFINCYRKILKDNGEIQLKTDNSLLFGYSIETLSQSGFVCTSCDLDFRAKLHDFDPMTEYEKKFIDLGQPIYRCVFVKGD